MCKRSCSNIDWLYTYTVYTVHRCRKWFINIGLKRILPLAPSIYQYDRTAWNCHKIFIFSVEFLKVRLHRQFFMQCLLQIPLQSRRGNLSRSRRVGLSHFYRLASSRAPMIPTSAEEPLAPSVHNLKSFN